MILKSQHDHDVHHYHDHPCQKKTHGTGMIQFMIMIMMMFLAPFRPAFFHLWLHRHGEHPGPAR